MENSGYPGSRICGASFFCLFPIFSEFSTTNCVSLRTLRDPPQGGGRGEDEGAQAGPAARGFPGALCARAAAALERIPSRVPAAPAALPRGRGALPASRSPAVLPRPPWRIGDLTLHGSVPVLNFPLGGAQGPLGGPKWPQPLPRVSLRPPPGARSASGVYTGSAAAGPVPGAASPPAGGSQKRGAAGARGRQGPEKSGRRRGEDRGWLLTKKKLNHQRNH